MYFYRPQFPLLQKYLEEASALKLQQILQQMFANCCDDSKSSRDSGCLYFGLCRNQIKDKGGRVAGSSARLQQDLEGAEREVLPQVSRPSRHQLQTERHQSASVQVLAE